MGTWKGFLFPRCSLSISTGNSVGLSLSLHFFLNNNHFFWYILFSSGPKYLTRLDWSFDAWKQPFDFYLCTYHLCADFAVKILLLSFQRQSQIHPYLGCCCCVLFFFWSVCVNSQPRGWELCFIWWEFLGLQAQETASQVALKELLQGGGGRSQIWIDPQ